MSKPDFEKEAKRLANPIVHWVEIVDAIQSAYRQGLLRGAEISESFCKDNPHHLNSCGCAVVEAIKKEAQGG